MFVWKQTCPQHLFLIIMKNLAKNVRAFKQILGKKQMFLLNHSCFCSQSNSELCEYICQMNITSTQFQK